MMTKVDSKYSLVVAAARRARVLREGGKTEIKAPRSHKFVGVALEEVFEDRITVTRGEE
ncbi:DNA-directed RNA polymerase subunit omega [compost metagenome]